MYYELSERLAKAKWRILDNLYVRDADNGSYILLSTLINDRRFQAEGKHFTELYAQFYYLYGGEYGEHWDYVPVDEPTVEKLKEIECELDELETLRKKYVDLKRELTLKLESFEVSL